MAFSPDFLRRYAQIVAQNQQVASSDASETAGTISSDLKKTTSGARKQIGNRISHWNYAQPQDVHVIVYDPSNGKAYPSPAYARASGVTRFVYNLPPGMTVDWSFWQQFAQPAEAQPEAYPMPIADQTVPFNPAPYSPNAYPAPAPSPAPAAAAPAPAAEPPPPPPTPGKIVSKAQWDQYATYLQGPGHTGPMSGKNIRANEGPNLDLYYKNYVASMEESNASGQYEKAKQTNKIHGLDPTKKSTEVKKETKKEEGPKVGSDAWRELHGYTM